MSGNEANEPKLNTIEEAILDIRLGKLVIVVDDEHRENEGDFIAAAEHATPELINFIATHGRGLICVLLTASRCKELELPLMVPERNELEDTKFTITVDAIVSNFSTGVSVQDRSRTVQALANPIKVSTDFSRPGHIFPLIAMDGGVLVRPGHTEAAVDLARLAGCQPSGVLSEILNEDGSMARLPQLLEISKKLGIKIISIEDLIEYRKVNNI
jgi:3,4-dihydroxy 2-butanone 4-phosphate synthase / GTP cyclohydrolase II